MTKKYTPQQVAWLRRAARSSGYVPYWMCSTGCRECPAAKDVKLPGENCSDVARRLVREIGAGKKKRGKTLWEKARWGSMKLERSYSGLVLAWLAGYRACQRYAKRERSKKV